jgi:excisionase family DNA binding protein
VAINKTKRRPTVDEHALVTSVNGACILLNKARDRVYALIKSGDLESYLDGRARRITTASIKDYIGRKLAASKGFERARYPGAEDSRAP